MVDALRKLHHALAPGGKVIDTQPLSQRPPVFGAAARVGALDMREWAQTIAAVDTAIEGALADGLFVLETEERIVVTDSFDSGGECVTEVREWAGTKLSSVLERKIRTASPPITLEQEVRVRLLARLSD